MLPRRFPADDLFRPNVFRVAVWHSVVMGNIKDGEFAPLMVYGRNPLRRLPHAFLIDGEIANAYNTC